MAQVFLAVIRAAVENSNQRTSRVLVADDDPSIRQLLCTIVKFEKLEVDCVADGLEAIEHLEARKYSVILLDLMMPRGNGFDVIQYLKASPPAQKPIILLITAYADQQFKEVDPAIVAGVIQKPFEVSDIGNLIRLCVTGYQHQLTQELANSDDSTVRRLAEKHGGDRHGAN